MPGWLRVTLWAGVVVALAWLAGRVLGVHGLPFAVVVQVLLMRWALVLLASVRLTLEGGWFRVHTWEPPVYRALGVLRYMALLRAVGWERFRQAAQGYDGTRRSLPRYERATREAEYSHLLLAVLCAAVIATAAVQRAWDTALWSLLTTLLLHVYPVLLQRTMRARLQRLGICGPGTQGGSGAQSDSGTQGDSGTQEQNLRV